MNYFSQTIFKINMFQKFKYLFIPVLFLTFSSGVNAQSAIEDSVKAIMSRHPVVGLSVAVVKGNHLVYTHSFGFKNLETKVPLENKNIFRIASISKSFTSTGLMQLVQKKKISLDDDVSDLVGFKIRNPKFPDKKITLRMVLSHTSSINDKEGYFTLDSINPAKNPNWAGCYNDYEPGTQYQYCNYNYNIAGTILEKESGERFDHYVYNHILKPLKIYGGFNVNDLDSNLFAQIYEYNKDSSGFFHSPAAYASRKNEIENYVMGYSTPVFSPAGGMKISATGLSRYMQMHMDKGELDGTRIISKKSERTMRKALSEKEHYGLGLLTTKNLIDGETMVGHTGGAYGLYSLMFFEPKKKFGIVIICNGCDPKYSNGFESVNREVANELYKQVIK